MWWRGRTRPVQCAKPLDKTPGDPPLKLKQPHIVIFATAPSEPSSVFVVIYGPTSGAVKRETPRTSQLNAPQTSSFEMVSQRPRSTQPGYPLQFGQLALISNNNGQVIGQITSNEGF